MQFRGEYLIMPKITRNWERNIDDSETSFIQEIPKIEVRKYVFLLKILSFNKSPSRVNYFLLSHACFVSIFELVMCRH